MNSLKDSVRSGIGFVEVLVAVLIAAVSAVPVVYMVSSSRTDTSKAINYLRAVELANEVIEWAQGVDFDDLDSVTFSTYVGTLADDSTGAITPMPVGAAVPPNPYWASGNFSADSLKYSEQYGNAFFFREVEFEDVTGSMNFSDGMIKRMTVRVKWNEGSAPSSVYNSERDRQVELSVLLLNDANMNY
ncbi:MAG: hypothetical protein GQF41_3550 [Candidatus Rifleibacterium amylolyticum]|nr:MAG: hypothetical protein GQF41_3550 [Candidatus Rifleibacterium amylolyticum]